MRLIFLWTMFAFYFGIFLDPSRASIHQPQIIWVDDIGNVSAVPFESNLSWKWLDIENQGYLSPYLEFKISLGEGVEIHQVEDSPYVERIDQKQLKLLVNGEVSTFFTTLESEKYGMKRFGLVIQLSVSIPDAFVHRTCKQLGVSLEPRKLRKTHLYSSLYCLRNGDNVEVVIEQSKGAESSKQVAAGLGEKSPMKRAHKTVFNLSEFQIGEKIDSFHVKREQESDASEFDIVKVEVVDVPLADKNDYDQNQKPSRFSFTGGIGFSSLNYKESPLLTGNIDLSEIALTLKGSSQFKLSDRWNLSLSAYGNVVPLTKSPEETASATFFGANGRVGYKLPFSTIDKIFSVSGGWYLWGMLVSDDSFGVSFLSGPQLLLLSTFNASGAHPFYIYFKLAPIFSSEGFSLSNKELSFGGGYRLTNTLFGKLGLDLTLDIAMFGIELVSPQRDISLTSYSLGVTVVF